MPVLWDDPRVQRGMTAQLAARRARIAAGETPLGWKLGFGAPAAMAKLRTPAPLTGFLMQRALLPSGSTVNVKGWTQPVIEPEIAVRMARALPAGMQPADALAAIASLTPAIEVADLNMIADADNVHEVLAGDIYQRHVVLSDKSRNGGDTAGLSARLTRHGTLAGETSEPEALTGKLPALLVHLANVLGAFGETLSAGDLVICGSVLPPVTVAADETEISYDLAPINSVSVRFSRD